MLIGPQDNERRLVFDIETNGLLDEMDTIHCIAIADLGTGKLHDYGPDQIDEAVAHLETGRQLIGHNIIGFDVPAIKKLYPAFRPPEDQLDTMVASRLLWPEIKSMDFGLYRKGILPGNFIGRHSLEAWGYRLGDYKGDYKGPWHTWSEEMHEYCIQDVRVTWKLLKRIEKQKPAHEAMAIDHTCQKILTDQKATGFPFKEAEAVDLVADLSAQRDKIRQEILDMVPNWPVKLREFTPQRADKRMGYTAGVTLTKIVFNEFNPGSDHHVADRLQALCGWKPVDFTDNGAPKVDEAVLKKLDYPLAKKIARWKLLNKRLEQLSEGKQAWMRNVHNGRIHHTCFPTGTVTGRGAHMHPNLGQIPSSKKPYGVECRSLFCADEGYEMAGSDLSGIELRCLAHYLARFDGGEFGRILLEGDIHWANAQALGLAPQDAEYDKENPDHYWAREKVAKTFIYAWLYGAQAAKIGGIIGKGRKEGQKLIDSFLDRMPAVAKLRQAVDDTVTGNKRKGIKPRKYLIGLDGRRIPVRRAHSALNSLLQGAGAAIAKKWMVVAHEDLEAQGYIHLVHFWQLAWAHDELQVQAPEGTGDEIGRIIANAAGRAGTELGVRVPIEADYDLGYSWAETH